MPAPVGDDELRSVRLKLGAQRDSLRDLEKGAGQWQRSDVGGAVAELRSAEYQLGSANAMVRGSSGSAHRDAKKRVKRWTGVVAEQRPVVEALVGPHREEIVSSLSSLETLKIDLENRAHARTEWLAAHPDTARRLEHLDTRLDVVDRALQVERDGLDGIDRTPTTTRAAHRTIGQELLDRLPAPEPATPRAPVIEGPDLGLGL